MASIEMTSQVTQIELTIDGRTVQAPQGCTILQAARGAGIDIPTLCHDERLSPYGSCFLCVVESPGIKKLLPACATEARAGMQVLTRSERVVAAAQRALELLLSDHYADCLGPCQAACPAGVDIQGYVALVAAGKYLEAARLIRERNPLPSVCGRVCVRKCEVGCRRSTLDGAVGINMIKRFATDRLDEDGQRGAFLPARESATGHRVAVIGAGPAGLAAADLLARRGHSVTIFEAAPHAGGMLRYGIPEYRLPRDLLDRDIQGVLDLGVELQTDRRLGRDFTLEGLKEQGFEAIFLGLGAQNGSPMKVPGEDLQGVLVGVDFLRDSELKGHPPLPGKVVVVGGGNTAIDCARSALRCGAEVVELVYRRTRQEMPANVEEIEAAIREGVRMTFLAAPVEVQGEGGKVTGMKVVRMELGEPDKSGRRRPVMVPGSETVIPCDWILAAIGQQVDLDGLQDAHAIGVTPWKTVVADEHGLATGMPGVFVGGDVVLGPAVAIDAIGQGRRAAAAIDRYLQHGSFDLGRGFASTKDTAGGPTPEELKRRIDEAGRGQARATLPERHAEGWAGDWKEVELGLSPEVVLQEALRCLSCGCTDFFTCDLRRLAGEYGADLSLTQGEVSRHEVDRRHPHLELDANKCILCAKCIRVCEGVLGTSALGLVNRGFSTVVRPTLGRPLQETNCISCGACADVCPTGADREKGTRAHRGPWRPAWQPLVCSRCGVGCELEIDRTGNQVLVRPKGGVEAPLGAICERGRYGHAFLASEARLRTPLLRGADGQLHPVLWEQALATAVEWLAPAARGGREAGVFLSTRLTCEELELALRLAREGVKAERIGSLEPLLRGLDVAALDLVDGLGVPGPTLADLDWARVIVLCNADPLTDHPVLGLAIRRAVRRGAKLVGIGTGNGLQREASLWLQPRRGSASCAVAWSARFLLGAGWPAEGGGADGLLPGLASLKHVLPDPDRDEAVRRCGVPAVDMEALARVLQESDGRVVAIFDPERATDRSEGLIQALALLLGSVRGLGEGRGLLLPTRYPNLRGLRATVLGATPSGAPVCGAQAATPLRQALAEGQLEVALLLGEDPLGDEALASGFRRPARLIVADTVATATTEAADLVLPLSPLAESQGSYLSCDGQRHVQPEIAAPVCGKSTLELLTALVRSLG